MSICDYNIINDYFLYFYNNGLKTHSLSLIKLRLKQFNDKFNEHLWFVTLFMSIRSWKKFFFLFNHAETLDPPPGKCNLWLWFVAAGVRNDSDCCIHLRVFRSKTCRFTPNSRVNAPKIMKIVQKKGKTHDFHEKKGKNRLFSGGGQKSLTRHPE